MPKHLKVSFFPPSKERTEPRMHYEQNHVCSFLILMVLTIEAVEHSKCIMQYFEKEKVVCNPAQYDGLQIKFLSPFNLMPPGQISWCFAFKRNRVSFGGRRPLAHVT